MSRRKQSNPARHLDGENDNRSKAIFTTTDVVHGDPELVGVVPEEEEEGHHAIPDQRDNEEYSDPVVCAHCRQEFRCNWDLMAHEKGCRALAVANAIPYDHHHLNNKIVEGVNGPMSGPGSVEGEEEEEDEEDLEVQGVSGEELLSRVDGEMMVEEGEEDLNEEFESGAPSDQDEYMTAPLSLTTSGGVGPDREAYPFIGPEQSKSEEENKENNSGLGNQNDEGEDSLPGNGEVADNYDPSSISALSGMFPGNNVTLEPMAATKAAVAQFPLSQSQMPANPSDAVKALEDLKRKDMFNQQLIHKMHMAMLKRGINLSEMVPEVYGMVPPIDMSAAVMMGPHSMAGYLSTQAEKIQKEEKALKEECKDIPKDLSLNLQQVIKQVDRERTQDVHKRKLDGGPEDSKPSSSVTSIDIPALPFSKPLPSSLSSVPSSSPLPLAPSSLSALSSMTNGSGLDLGSSSVKQEGGSRGGGSSQYSSSSLTALQRETDALKAHILPQLHMPMTPEAYRGYCQRGTILERTQYACDDPFFKHKCRFCHKVFGSDSALQIHVRSHTGERPFKCNICGNRFSTKGNLKVHFERHKAKYPHIKMNPNPVPESFDRVQPPVVPPPLSSSTPIPSSLPLPSGLMPGDVHSPGTPRMMFPPGVGGPGGFFPPTPVGMTGGYLPHPFSPRLPGPPHMPLMPPGPRCLMSPRSLQADLPPSSPKASPGDSSRSGSDLARPLSRAETDVGRPSSHGSTDKSGGSRPTSSPPPQLPLPPPPPPHHLHSLPPSSVPGPPPPPPPPPAIPLPPPSSSSSSSASSPASSASSFPAACPTGTSVRSQPSTPASSMAATLGSPPIPPLIPAHPPMVGHIPHSMHSPLHPLARSTPGPIFSNHSLPATPTSFPLPSPLSAFPALMRGHGNPFAVPPSLPVTSSPAVADDGLFRSSILPTKTIDPNENVEQYMDIEKSETSKLEQLVNDIPDKVREPNQCVICQRVLSCKSALQMHYRIHTGERPFRCKICSRKFTTKGNLKTHMGVHRTKTPMRMIHSCPVCPKAFNNILVLHQHIRQAHGNLSGNPMAGLSVYPHLPGWPANSRLPHAHVLPLPPPPHHRSYEPFDLSRHREPKELDLSNKRNNHLFLGPDRHTRKTSSSSFASGRDETAAQDEDDERIEEDDGDVKKEEEMIGAEEMDRMGEEDREEEAYNLSRDGDLNGPASHGPHSSAFSDNGGDSDRPDSNVSAMYGGYDMNQPLPPTADILDPFINPSLPPPRGVANPSLAALEDHVKNISVSVSQSGFESFRNSMGFGTSPFLMDKSLSPGVMMGHPNGGTKSPSSPRSQGASEAGSDGSREDPTNKFPMADFPVGYPMLDMELVCGTKNTTCRTCFKTFACKSALETHMRSHTKERPFKCDECERAFSTKGNLKQHQLTHKTARDAALEFAETVRNNGASDHCSDSGEPNNQDGSFSSQPPSSPAADGAPTATSSSLPAGPPQPQSADQNERQTEKSQVPSSLVPDCPFDNSESGGTHVVSSLSSASSPLQSQQQLPATPSSTPSSLAPNKPNITNTTTPNNNNNHHSGSSPSNKNNNNNNKSFPDSNSVKRELNTSGGQSPRDMVAKKPKHVCDTCLKPFSSASALQIHTRTHTGDKPFKCEVCKKAFTTRGNLKVHMGTHAYNSAPSRRGRRMSIDSPIFFPGNPYLPPGFPPATPRHAPHHDLFYPYSNLMNGMAPSRHNEIPVIQNVNGGLGPHHPLSMYSPFAAHPFPTLPGVEEAAKHAADLSLSRSHSSDGGSLVERDRDRRPPLTRDTSSPPPTKRMRDSSRSPPYGYPPSSSSSSSSSLPNGSADLAGTLTSTGELDLSMKPSPPTRPSPQKTSPNPSYPSPPRLAYPTSPAAPITPSPTMNQPSGDRTFAGSPPSQPCPPPADGKDNSQESVLPSSPATWVWNTLNCNRCGQSFPGPSTLEQHIATHHSNDGSSSNQPITA